MLFFFFSSRRRHTRWNCDWSSDVCSSDLIGDDARVRQPPAGQPGGEGPRGLADGDRRLAGAAARVPRLGPGAGTLAGLMLDAGEDMSGRGDLPVQLAQQEVAERDRG